MSVVLDVQPDTDYEPSEAEMIEYGKWLGMEMPQDMPLLWIAREGLKAPLPDNWKACKSEKGELYYFNFKTGQSIWDHPSDEHYRELLSAEKAKLNAKGNEKKQADNAAATDAPSGKRGKSSKKKKSKSRDAEASETKASAQDEKKITSTVQQVQTAPLVQTIQPKKDAPGPIKLASLGADVLKGEKNSAGHMGSPEFPSPTSQDDSPLASELHKPPKADEPDAIPLPTKVVAGGGVNGLRALDKLGRSSSTASSDAAMKAAGVSLAKEQKGKSDLQVAKELEAYKTEQQKALQAKADGQLAKDLEIYKAERNSSLRAKIDQDVEKELDTYKAEQENLLSRRKQEIDGNAAEEVRRYEEQANAEKEKRRKASERELATAVEGDSERLKKELEEKLNELRQKYEAKRTTESERLRGKLNAQLDHDKRKVEAEVAQMLETFTREKRQESEIKKEAQSQALQEASKYMSDLKQCAASFLRQYEEALSKFAKAVQNSKTVFDQIDAQKQMELQNDLAAKLTEMTRDHEEQVEQEKQRMKAQLESLKKDYISEVDSLKQSHQQELQKLRDSFDEQRNQSQQEQVSKEHQRFMETLADIKEAQAKELNELKRQLKEKAQEELNEIVQELAKEKQSHRSNGSNARDSVSHEPAPRMLKSSSQSVTDEEESSERAKLSPPRLNSKLLAHPLRDESAAATPAAQSQHQDIKTLITEALREVFAGSPFILSSPGQGGESQTAPLTPATPPTPAASSSSAAAKASPELRSPNAFSTQAASLSGNRNKSGGVLSLPLSFQEQHNLVESERRRLQEGRKYVELQQQNLDERRQQLKRTRHQWKQDVLTAKAEGIRSSSKRGQLLNKVRLSLEEQARGLEHDLLILRDSQVWLLSKEQRLMALERQIEEQERLKNRSGGDASTLNNISVDTAALMTGYFKPQRHSIVTADTPVYRDAIRRGSLEGTSLPFADNCATSPVLTKALSRIEKCLDEVTSIIHQQQQQQQQTSLQALGTPQSHGSRRHSTVSPMLRDATQGRARRSSHSQAKSEILRRESHLDQWQGTVN
ncbi:hypothetical protein ABB37_08291 [Leptomonas pyrrhocoris]|uniref:WW domain-containing protein n=1 Tax=Leptomonas pyrrhocoris TaxID=157538 RepID=A0A0M9FTV0_LEPPY|nr:hypothetical protein ABB37_08291 [Leptomonas pyrrhocoris]XP_015654195.1 hypothetical protein ABB37_08291 [Leptomonas pyrrhocoris]KPA75755.1 hypothetical protein ABB37_08291 [Leptomonas pyrrhocoris]KPA75756.1 hypothetical protein ABB37_08291 [Leptomonas pyrrhocoris]|eukprot:XP_015654194.1 hypothetical protein ABB37_08291 [Leptomonas pyrrhocoris]